MAEDKQEKSQKRADGLFGQIAVKLGILTKAQLQEVLELQRFARGHKPLGVLLMELNYVTQKDLEDLLEVLLRDVVELHQQDAQGLVAAGEALQLQHFLQLRLRQDSELHRDLAEEAVRALLGLFLLIFGHGRSSALRSSSRRGSSASGSSSPRYQCSSARARGSRPRRREAGRGRGPSPGTRASARCRSPAPCRTRRSSTTASP